jgi:rubredoxin
MRSAAPKLSASGLVRTAGGACFEAHSGKLMEPSETVAAEVVFCYIRKRAEAHIFLARCVMGKYICETCGYVYDPADGDGDAGIKPGTAFADLPADWACPTCGHGKEVFSPSD